MSNYDKINTLFKFECIVLFKSNTAWKVSVFGVILARIQSECGKIQTRITPNMDTLYAVLDMFYEVCLFWFCTSFSVKLPSIIACNIVVMSGLMLLTATWIRICSGVSPTLTAFFKSLTHCQNITSLKTIFRYCFETCLS